MHYSAAKFGVVGIMRCLANELAPHFIRVNCLHPSAVSTAMLHNDTIYQLFRPDADIPTLEEAIPVFTTLNALPIPWVETIDISNALLFLASDASRYVTSVSLPVDAGATQRG